MVAEQMDAARRIVADSPRNAPFEDWRHSVLAGEHDDHPEVIAACASLTSASSATTPTIAASVCSQTIRRKSNVRNR